MKHFYYTFLLLLTFLLLSTASLFASSDFFFTKVTVGPSAVIYGDSELKEQNELLKSLDHTHQFILSTDVALGLNLSPQIELVSGGLLTADLNISSSYYIHRLDYGFFTGFRVHTGLGGFVCGVDYICGQRADFYSLPDDSANSDSTSWGNGFRFLAEYDFSNGISSNWAPVINLAWRRMPRSNSFDNNITVALIFNF